MSRIAVLALMAGLTALAVNKTTAQNVTTVPVKPAPLFKIFPPVEYDHFYEGDLTIKIVATLEELHALCRLDGPQLLACTMRNEKSCIIIMVEDEVMRKRNWTTGLLPRSPER